MARPSKSTAIGRLRRALDEIPELKKIPSSRPNSLLHAWLLEHPKFRNWKKRTKTVIARTLGAESFHVKDFTDIHYEPRGGIGVEHTSRECLEAYLAALDLATLVLESAIEEVEEDWEDKNQTSLSPTAQSSAAPENEPTNTNEVFVIHGRDNEAKETVARFLQRLDLTPVILHEQPNQGRTIIEKFEQHAQVGFAVALLTPDDVGAFRDARDDLKPRARQNVVFELGYFLGRLGRERVCALTKGNVELPSDYDGVVYVSLDDGGWKMDLIRELKNVGFDVDANRAL